MSISPTFLKQIFGKLYSNPGMLTNCKMSDTRWIVLSRRLFTAFHYFHYLFQWFFWQITSSDCVTSLLYNYSVVNFISILWAPFVPKTCKAKLQLEKSFAKHFCTKKGARKMLIKGLKGSLWYPVSTLRKFLTKM